MNDGKRESKQKPERMRQREVVGQKDREIKKWKKNMKETERRGKGKGKVVN